MGAFLLILLVVLLVLVCYLLFAPILIEINSISGVCRMQFHRLAEFAISWRQEAPILKLTIAWWQKEMNLFSIRKTTAVEKVGPAHEERKPAGKSKRSLRMGLSKGIGIVKSFKVRECYISLDTGNMPLNGILYPWFYLLSYYFRKPIQINFYGEEVFIISIENNMARIALAYLKS